MDRGAANLERPVAVLPCSPQNRAGQGPLFRHSGLERILSAQREHLAGLGHFLKKQYLPSARIELYQARIVPNGAGRGVSFEPILTA